ncbi:MAG: thymidine phosphorylase [Dehalococcoidia bacterium]
MQQPLDLRYRPLAAKDLAVVPLQCQGERSEVRGRIAACGSSAMLAFDGDRCVAQLQFRPYAAQTRSPRGIHDPLYWMDYPAELPELPEPALSLFCYHVGQVDDDPERREPRYLGRGIGQELLQQTLAWAPEHGFAAVVAKGLAPCWPVIQYMGGMPWPVYEQHGFRLLLAYHDPELRQVLDELLLGAYGPRRLMELTEEIEKGADLDALAEVRVYARLNNHPPLTTHHSPLTIHPVIMRTVDLILKKRGGGRLSRAELAYLIGGATAGTIPDYQLAAWLMAVCWQGMTDDETADLTLEMAASGRMQSLAGIGAGGVVVDKHSTGGVGDKATLVVAPLVAACGVPFAKLSGRGLGHTGGTIDKLESFAGFRTALDGTEFLRLLGEHGLAIAGQSADLAPADGVLYALRDATGTVESIPLIASSIMSKKLAGGASAILLDVKVGSGAFMKERDEAEALARLMVAIGVHAGRRVEAVLSNMRQPLGRAVGNALEVREAIETLRGEGPADLDELCRHEAEALLLLAGRADGREEARAIVDGAIADGSALRKLAEVIAAQGGDARDVYDPERLTTAPAVLPLPSPRPGYLAELDALAIGLASVRLGAGRALKGEAIRHDVGFMLHKKVGDRVEAGEPLLDVYARTRAEAEAALDAALTACRFSDTSVPPQPVLL